MDIIRPVTVTDSVLVSSTVTEDDYAEWLVGTTYDTGDKVIVISTHRIYESLIGANTGNNPTTDDGTKWLDIGATNRWKAFDQKISDPVTDTGSIEYVLSSADTNVTAVSLFGVQASFATVVATDTGGAGEVYNETLSLIDNSDVTDWYSYFFEPITFKTEALFTDIPPYLGLDVEITVDSGSGEPVEMGQIVIGSLQDLGFTTYGTTIGIEDFSRKETDAFGNFIIVERAFSYTVDYDVRIPTQTARRVQNLLASFRASPLVYIGNPDDSYGTIVYGFYRNFDINLETPSYSLASIEVEGLT
jgi:hypothetical protein